MKKVIILIILGAIVSSCASTAHCDAYSQVEQEQTDSTKSI
jgi:hypothetical protein